MAKEFDTPLILTTPEMRGQNVKDAQWLMSGHSRFTGLATLKDSDIDGVYGKKSADATKRTKYWVGYPLASCDRHFGQTLYEYLNPNISRPLPKEYATRRASRLKGAQQTPGMKALALAVNEIGYHETPVNRTKYGIEYGFNGVPWCAIFESIMFKHSGRPSYHYASCQMIHADAYAFRNGLWEVWTPRPGDIAIFNIHGDPFAHTSFFEKWIDQAAGTFNDVGGNTGPTNISNGGAVMRQERYTHMVSHYVRVG